MLPYLSISMMSLATVYLIDTDGTDLLSLFAGLVSMMNALVIKKNRVEIADLPNQKLL